MSHFNVKSLSFYGGAIAFVVVLFTIVTGYGEAHLKAPSKVDGRYKIAAQDLPDCLKSNQLVLLLQQSGVYLSGSLLPENASDQQVKAAEERPSLTGKWNNGQFNLEGTAKSVPECQGMVAVQGTGKETTEKGTISTLSGTVGFDSSASKVNFTAEREAEQPSSQKSTH